MPKSDVTLVAHYGSQRPGNLMALVLDLQKEIEARVTTARFQRYVPEQVHGTIIGLEGIPVGSEVINTNYLKARGVASPIDLPSIAGFAQSTSLLPVNIRIGGYDPAIPFPFLSRQLHPYFRSFSIQGEIAVAMGWAVSPNATGSGVWFPMAVDNLRRSFNDYNVLHKYHGTDADVDNDFFFVLGRLDRAKLTQLEIIQLQNDVRDFMYRYGPTDIRIDHKALSLVVYTDTKLPPPSAGQSPSVQYPLGGGPLNFGGWQQWYR